MANTGARGQNGRKRIQVPPGHTPTRHQGPGKRSLQVPPQAGLPSMRKGYSTNPHARPKSRSAGNHTAARRSVTASAHDTGLDVDDDADDDDDDDDNDDDDDVEFVGGTLGAARSSSIMTPPLLPAPARTGSSVARPAAPRATGTLHQPIPLCMPVSSSSSSSSSSAARPPQGTIHVLASSESDEEGPTEDERIIAMMAGRKFSTEYPAEEKRKLLKNILANDPSSYVPKDDVKTIQPAWKAFARQAKNKSTWSNWKIRDIAPSLHLLGKAIFDEHDKAEKSSIRISKAAREIMQFYEMYRQEVATEVEKSKASAVARKARARAQTGLKGIPQNFRYREEMTDSSFPCPNFKCQHFYLQRLNTDEEIDAEEAANDHQQKQKLAQWRAQPVSQRTKNPPRGKGRPPKKWHCACYLLNGGGQEGGGNCPACKIRWESTGELSLIQDPNGKPGQMISGCEICLCMCSTGPFTSAEKQDLYRDTKHASRAKSQAGPPKQEDTMLKLGSILNGAMQQGESDLRYNNSDRSEASVQGATAWHLSRFQFANDADQYNLQNILGESTDRFPNGDHYDDIARRPKGSRYYRNSLAQSGASSTRSGIVDMTGAEEMAGASTPVATPRRSTTAAPAGEAEGAARGGLAKRIRFKMKTQMKANAATPGTKEKYRKIRNDMADSSNNATKDIIRDAEEDGDESQDVLTLLLENTG